MRRSGASENLLQYPAMQIFKAGVVYFSLVFAAGFALGTARVLLLVSRLGERTAELIEAPVMIVVSYFAARWVVRRCVLPRTAGHRLAVGLIALALMLGFEFGLVLQLRGLTLTEYFATRDPVSGAVYYLSLILYAFYPLLVRRNGSES